MASPPDAARVYTYDDLRTFPEDNFRREIIDGELIVSPAPRTRHQRVVLELGSALLAYTKERGGDVFVAPTDVWFSDINVVEPDVLFVTAEHAARVEEMLVRSAPDIVVEVSSPSNRRLDIFRKRGLYERFGVPEYWFVDLESDRVEVYRLDGGRYGRPTLLERGDALDSPHAPGFSTLVNDLLGAEEPDSPSAG